MPTPQDIGGKDPGDAYREGIDLRSWVMSSLPPYFHIKADLETERKNRKAVRAAAIVRQEEELLKEMDDIDAVQLPDIPQDEEKNAEITPIEAGKGKGPEEIPVVNTVTLTNGRSFIITSDRDEWERLTEAGEVVFSENELRRLQKACSTMDADERFKAAMLALDVKELFSPAWIRRGETI